MVQEHLPAEMRKDQIANAALELVAQYGVRGATVARISERVGISVPAVYAHFGTKREVLLTTLDLVFEKIRAIHRSSQETNALERLREDRPPAHKPCRVGNQRICVCSLRVYCRVSLRRIARFDRRESPRTGPGFRNHCERRPEARDYSGRRRPGASRLAAGQSSLDRGRSSTRWHQ